MITFEKSEKRAVILNPLKSFREDVVAFEYRTDPLTGRNTTVIKGMLDYVSKFLVSDEKLLESLVEKTRINCPFCPKNVRSRTPMFPPDFLKEGRIVVGDVVVVPNLLGHAERSVLAVLSREHHLRLRDFTLKLLLDGFKGGVAYLKRLKELEPDICFPAFIFNYLPPAGSSILHPHMQILARDRPTYLVKLMLEKSKAYHRRAESSYWADLSRKEKRGERHLFEKGRVEWLVPFAPLRGMNEVEAVVRDRSHLLELNNEDWSALAEGIAWILQFYDKEGYSSFNVILMSGPMSKHLDYFDVNLRMINRPGVQGMGFTDAWALPYLLWDGETVEEPEQFAQRLRTFISGVKG